MSLSLFEQIVSPQNVDDAYRKCQLGKARYKSDSLLFERNRTDNINRVVQSIINGSYRMGKYVRFYVYEPKKREIYAPQFKDKLVQMMVNNVLKRIYFPCFIYDSYACIDNKGTHKASQRISHFLRKAGWVYGEQAYIIKLDVRRFFYSIDREILKKLLVKKIKCAWTLELLYTIIDSSPNELGLPLGNITSHIFANLYLNEFDQYCKRVLRLKYYVRYMDDSFAVVQDKATARRVLGLMVDFLEQRLNLNANPNKTMIFPLEQGVNVVGFKTYRTHRLLRNDSKKKIKRKLRKMEGLIRSGRMTVDKAEQILNSWLGHAGHASSYNFIQRLLKRHSFLKLNRKGVLKIDTGEVAV